MLSNMLLLYDGDLQWQIETMIRDKKLSCFGNSLIFMKWLIIGRRGWLHVGVATKQYTINLTGYDETLQFSMFQRITFMQ
jgi:hypothetical protein